MNKVTSILSKTWIVLKDFFNMKDWVKMLRSIPAVALALIAVGTVLMNILANKSIIELPWLIQDAGVLLSWVGFLVGDLLVKNFGSKNAIRVSLTCLVLSLFISGLLAIVAVIPGTWSSEFGLPNDTAETVGNAINSVMGNVWYVILGSALASAIGLIINGLSQGFILNKIEKKHGDRYWGYLTASATSTILGQFIDNFIFAAVVSVNFFGWTWTQVFVCSIAGALFELIIEMLFTPLTYKISKNWEKNKIGIKFWNEESEVKDDQ